MASIQANKNLSRLNGDFELDSGACGVKACENVILENYELLDNDQTYYHCTHSHVKRSLSLDNYKIYDFGLAV